MTMTERLAIHTEIEEANRKREREMADRENLRYSVYRGAYKPGCFVGAFEGYTLPELEKMLNIRDLMVIPDSVHRYWMKAIGK